jgi:hypothetical protein
MAAGGQCGWCKDSGSLLANHAARVLTERWLPAAVKQSARLIAVMSMKIDVAAISGTARLTCITNGPGKNGSICKKILRGGNRDVWSTPSGISVLYTATGTWIRIDSALSLGAGCRWQRYGVARTDHHLDDNAQRVTGLEEF